MELAGGEDTEKGVEVGAFIVCVQRLEQRAQPLRSIVGTDQIESESINDAVCIPSAHPPPPHLYPKTENRTGISQPKPRAQQHSNLLPPHLGGNPPTRIRDLRAEPPRI